MSFLLHFMRNYVVVQFILHNGLPLLLYTSLLLLSYTSYLVNFFDPRLRPRGIKKTKTK